jgi:hypothetical protein
LSKHLIIRVDLDGKTDVLLDRKGIWVGSLTLPPDGRHLAYSQATSDENVWLLDLFGNALLDCIPDESLKLLDSRP